jgi:voltage-gated potassium channel
MSRTATDPEPRRAAAPHPVQLLVERLWPAAAISVALVAVASIGYVVIADYSWFDALYMTIITLGTIGYQEVQPLGSDGRAWTIGVIAAGFFLLLYVASVLTSLFVSGDLSRVVRERRGAKMRAQLDEHVIVVGFGRVGAATTAAIITQKRPCAVVDLDIERVPAIEAAGAVALTGDGREESTLRAAGIERCTALVAAAHDDASNLVIVLTARALRSDLRIVARVNDPMWASRMARAGADVSMSPYDSVGASLAASAIERSVIGLHDLPGLGIRTEEIVVGAGSPAVGQSLRGLALEQPDVLLLGLHDVGGLNRWQEVTSDLAVGDVVLALGPPDALAQLAHRLSGAVEAR